MKYSRETHTWLQQENCGRIKLLLSLTSQYDTNSTAGSEQGKSTVQKH